MKELENLRLYLHRAIFQEIGQTEEETERNHILKILSETRWRIEGKVGAAAILGLHPSTSRVRMHELGILRPELNESD